MMNKFWMTAAACAALAGCGTIPDYRPPMPAAPMGVYPTGPAMPVEPMAPIAATPGAPTASGAESACMSAGRDAGFDVQSVVGTREVSGGTARDVMLRVNRSGRTIEVRCNYAYDSGQARIMTL